MCHELDAESIAALAIEERKVIIEAAAADVVFPETVPDNLQPAFQLSQILNTFLPNYFLNQIRMDEESGSILSETRQHQGIQTEIGQFQHKTVRWFREEFSVTIDNMALLPLNLFELSGAHLLASANRVTRHLSRTMGHLWERISNLSPYVIDPKMEFGVDITGIDVIVFDTGQVRYAQLKTKKDTLTGSQAPRSKNELSLHENPMFVACFETNSHWTFSSNDIRRYVGEEYWDIIGMDYGFIVNSVSEMISRFEDEFRLATTADVDLTGQAVRTPEGG